MKFYKIIIVAASVFALVACSTSKEISYFQDLRPGESELMLAVPMEIKIQPKDKLSIFGQQPGFEADQPVQPSDRQPASGTGQFIGDKPGTVRLYGGLQG